MHACTMHMILCLIKHKNKKKKHFEMTQQLIQKYKTRKKNGGFTIYLIQLQTNARVLSP